MQLVVVVVLDISDISDTYMYFHGDVMKIGNIMPRAGIESTSLAILGQFANHIGSLMSPPNLYLPVYVALYLRGQCRLLQYY